MGVGLGTKEAGYTGGQELHGEMVMGYRDCIWLRGGVVDGLLQVDE